MKSAPIKLFTLLAASLFIIAACENTGKGEFDGHKSIEGKSDPANTGGKLGGSQAETDRMNDKDSVKQDR
jgi:hypothetical protein